MTNRPLKSTSLYPIDLEMAPLGEAHEELETDAVPCSPGIAAGGDIRDNPRGSHHSDLAERLPHSLQQAIDRADPECSATRSEMAPLGEAHEELETDAVPCSPGIAAGGDIRDNPRGSHHSDLAESLPHFLQQAIDRADPECATTRSGGDDCDDNFEEDLRKQLPHSLQRLAGDDVQDADSIASGKGSAGPHAQESSLQSSSKSTVSSSEPSSESSDSSKHSTVEEASATIPDSELPPFSPELSFEYYDILLLYSRDEWKEAMVVKDHLESSKLWLKSGKPIKVLMYDDLLNTFSRKIDCLEKGMEHCTYIFLYLTKKFCECDFSRFCSETCLMASIEDNNKRWTVVPIYTQHRRKASFKVPIGLLSLKGITYHSQDEFYFMNLKKLVEERMCIRQEREKKWEERKEEWKEQTRFEMLKDRGRKQIEKKQKEARRKQEMDSLEQENTGEYSNPVLHYKDLSTNTDPSGPCKPDQLNKSHSASSVLYSRTPASNPVEPNYHPSQMAAQQAPGNFPYWSPPFQPQQGYPGGYPYPPSCLFPGPSGTVPHSASVPVMFPYTPYQQQQQQHYPANMYMYPHQFHTHGSMPMWPSNPPYLAGNQAGNQEQYMSQSVTSSHGNKPHFSLDGQSGDLKAMDSGVYCKALSDRDNSVRMEQMHAEKTPSASAGIPRENPLQGELSTESAHFKSGGLSRGASAVTQEPRRNFDACDYLLQRPGRDIDLPEKVEEDAQTYVEETGVKELTDTTSRVHGNILGQSLPKINLTVDTGYESRNQTASKTTCPSSSVITSESSHAVLKPEHLTSSQRGRETSAQSLLGRGDLGNSDSLEGGAKVIIHHHHYHEAKAEPAEESKKVFIFNDCTDVRIGDSHSVLTTETTSADMDEGGLQSRQDTGWISDSSGSPTKADHRFPGEVDSNICDSLKIQASQQKYEAEGGYEVRQKESTGQVVPLQTEMAPFSEEEKEATFAKLSYDDDQDEGIEGVHGSTVKLEGSLSAGKSKSTNSQECSLSLLPHSPVTESDRMIAGMNTSPTHQGEQCELNNNQFSEESVHSHPHVTEGRAVDTNETDVTLSTLLLPVLCQAGSSSWVKPATNPRQIPNSEFGTDITVTSRDITNLPTKPVIAELKTDIPTRCDIETNIPNAEMDIAQGSHSSLDSQPQSGEYLDSGRQGSSWNESSFEGTSVDPPQESSRGRNPFKRRSKKEGHNESNKNCVIS